MFCATCFSLLRRIISLLRRNYLPVIVLFRVHRQTLPNLLLFKLIFVQKPVLTRQLSLFSACYQGESGREAPS